MDQWASLLLTWLASLFVSSTLPINDQGGNVWQTKGWEVQNGVHQLKISAPIEKLKCTPGKYLQSPMLLYGKVHFLANDHIFAKFGDAFNNRAYYIFNAPEIPCEQLPTSGVFSIIFYGYSPAYSQITYWPQVVNFSFSDLFLKFAYFAGGLSLLFLAIYLLITVLKFENQRITLLIVSSAFLISIYELGVVAPVFSLSLSTLIMHKISDLCLTLGMVLLSRTFAREQYILMNITTFEVSIKDGTALG